MVTLSNRFAALPSGMFDINAAQDGRFGWFLLTWHPESDPVLEEIQTQIKLDIRGSALGQTSQLEIESWLKSFFSEYHWKLHAAFRKTNLKEKGISLLLGVLFNHELYIVEFGRMLCGIVDNDYIQPAGRNWTNFHVKSLDEMALLGMSETDILVKPKRLLLAPRQRFIALPSVYADKLAKSNADAATIETLLQSFTEDSSGCYFILEGTAKPSVRRRHRLRRHQVSALLVIILALLAIVYMLFGNRWLESMGRKVKLLLTSKNRLTVERVPEYLNIQSQTIKRQLQKIEQYANQPARYIKLVQSWKTDLNFLITAAPAFDPQNIYVASEDKLLAFAKSSKKLVWSKTFPAGVREVNVIRGNLIAFLDDGQINCLNSGGQISWSKSRAEILSGKQTLAPCEIDNANDPRINNSILLVPAERGLYVYDVNSGRLLSELAFKNRLQYLSAYDAFDNCFYAVVADGVLCINLDIMN
jgi:hypothetical protein